jgi:hypothetical protein
MNHSIEESLAILGTHKPRLTPLATLGLLLLVLFIRIAGTPRKRQGIDFQFSHQQTFQSKKKTEYPT